MRFGRIQGMDYKYGPAIESVGMALVAILSCITLKEKMTKRRLAGTILVIIGFNCILLVRR